MQIKKLHVLFNITLSQVVSKVLNTYNNICETKNV